MSYSTLSQVGDNIYVNVVINNSSGSNRDIEGSIAAEYQVTKTIPILSRCDDYYCSVIRFDVPLDAVPLFIMPIVPNQANPNLTPLIIGIRIGGVDFPQPLIYVPQPGIPGPPLQNLPIQNITPYYYIYEYQILINMLNRALSLALVASGLGASNAYFYLDTVSEEINLVVDIIPFAFIATNGLPNPIPPAVIFMNSSLETYLNALQADFVGPNANGRDYVFNLVRFGLDNNIPPFNIGAVATQRRFSQEYSTLALWSSLRKIVIVSNSIPILPEFTPSTNSGISSTLPILTDFVPNIEDAGEVRSIAFYNPQSQYRLVDMMSSEQLNTIDLKIYWQDIQQNIYPIYITRFQQASVKLGFFKKKLYNSLYISTLTKKI